MGTGSDTEQDWAPFSCTDLAVTPAPYGDLHTVSPFVATPQAAIDLILKGLKLTSDDFLVDLGCGHGTINICAASQYKCGGLGVDIDGTLVEEARREAEDKGVSERIELGRRMLPRLICPQPLPLLPFWFHVSCASFNQLC